MSEPISLDTDAAAATAAEWRGYAEQVEQHGSHQHVSLDQLRSALGDIYGPYVQAKGEEYEARRAAYQRVAEHARGHAGRLEGTRRIFTNTDDEHANRISRVAAAVDCPPGSADPAGDPRGSDSLSAPPGVHMVSRQVPPPLGTDGNGEDGEEFLNDFVDRLILGGAWTWAGTGKR